MTVWKAIHDGLPNPTQALFGVFRRISLPRVLLGSLPSEDSTPIIAFAQSLCSDACASAVSSSIAALLTNDGVDSAAVVCCPK
jgi:hypothetical protein